ncbi:MAG: hypothetical protein K6G64_08655 [Eubacterium sp.]|nr:hypothetical protein [Eubacterium sp.]
MEDKRIDEIIAMLDGSVKKGDGHINVTVDDTKETEQTISRGCCDNSDNPTACSVPTLELPDDDEFQR